MHVAAHVLIDMDAQLQREIREDEAEAEESVETEEVVEADDTHVLSDLAAATAEHHAANDLIDDWYANPSTQEALDGARARLHAANLVIEDMDVELGVYAWGGAQPAPGSSVEEEAQAEESLPDFDDESDAQYFAQIEALWNDEEREDDAEEEHEDEEPEDEEHEDEEELAPHEARSPLYLAITGYGQRLAEIVELAGVFAPHEVSPAHLANADLVQGFTEMLDRAENTREDNAELGIETEVGGPGYIDPRLLEIINEFIERHNEAEAAIEDAIRARAVEEVSAFLEQNPNWGTPPEDDEEDEDPDWSNSQENDEEDEE